MRPGDEIFFNDATWLVLDPHYLEKASTEHLATGEERIVTLEEWESRNLDASLIDDPVLSREQPVHCSSCGD